MAAPLSSFPKQQVSIMDLIARLREDLPASDPLFETLVPLLLTPTGTSSAGYPYLEQAAWEQFRDTVPLRTPTMSANLPCGSQSLPTGSALASSWISTASVYVRAFHRADLARPSLPANA